MISVVLSYLDCEQSLFSFRFSKGSARARAPALSDEVVPLLYLSRLAPSVTRVVIYVFWAFRSTDQEKKETARSLSPTKPRSQV